MKDKTHKGQRANQRATIRASVTFPQELYETLERIAGGKKVSLAWVVREAAEMYVEEQMPLFKGQR